MHLITLLIFLSFPAFGQCIEDRGLDLRIENIQTQGYRYIDTGSFAFSPDESWGKLGLAGGVVTFNDYLQEKVSFGLVPYKFINTSVSQTCFTTTKVLGSFTFSRKDFQKTPDLSIQAIYTFDLTDGETRYKVRGDVTLYRNRGAGNQMVLKLTNPTTNQPLNTFIFDHPTVTHTVQFNPYGDQLNVVYTALEQDLPVQVFYRVTAKPTSLREYRNRAVSPRLLK